MPGYLSIPSVSPAGLTFRWPVDTENSVGLCCWHKGTEAKRTLDKQPQLPPQGSTVCHSAGRQCGGNQGEPKTRGGPF
jgi:hypothetical protein